MNVINQSKKVSESINILSLSFSKQSEESLSLEVSQIIDLYCRNHSLECTDKIEKAANNLLDIASSFQDDMLYLIYVSSTLVDCPSIIRLKDLNDSFLLDRFPSKEALVFKNLCKINKYYWENSEINNWTSILFAIKLVMHPMDEKRITASLKDKSFNECHDIVLSMLLVSSLVVNIDKNVIINDENIDFNPTKQSEQISSIAAKIFDYLSKRNYLFLMIFIETGNRKIRRITDLFQRLSIIISTGEYESRNPDNF